jgi:hypothetical protein
VGFLWGAVQLVGLGLLFLIAFGPIAGSLGLILLYSPPYPGYPIYLTALYPFLASRAAFAFYLVFLFLATQRQARLKGVQKGFTLFSLGASNALVGLMGGAFFFTALSSSAAFIFWNWRTSQIKPSEKLKEVALFSFGFLMLFSFLIVPPLLKYGTLINSDSARFWLNDSYKSGQSLISLVLLEHRSPHFFLAVPVLFITFHFKRLYRPFLGVMGVAYIYTLLAGHWGFVINLTEPRLQWLRWIARRTLLASTHSMLTANYAIEWLLLIFCLVLWAGPIFQTLLNKPRKPLRTAIEMIVFISSAYWLFFKGPFIKLEPNNLVATDPITSRFIRAVEARTPANDTIYASNPYDLIKMVPVRLLSIDAPPFDNPYVMKERKIAQDTMTSGALPEIEKIVQRYDVKWAFSETNSPDPAIITICKRSGVAPEITSEWYPVNGNPNGFRYEIYSVPECLKKSDISKTRPF